MNRREFLAGVAATALAVPKIAQQIDWLDQTKDFPIIEQLSDFQDGKFLQEMQEWLTRAYMHFGMQIPDERLMKELCRTQTEVEMQEWHRNLKELYGDRKCHATNSRPDATPSTAMFPTIPEMERSRSLSPLVMSKERDGFTSGKCSVLISKPGHLSSL